MGATLKRKCCCGCAEGGTVTKWQNVTNVYTAPGVHGSPPGTRATYPWYVNTPGLNFQPTQSIADTVNDIMACAPQDGTHFTSDHNCYQANGTINLSSKQRFGGKWLTAQKQWHGSFGIKDQDDPNIITSASAPTGLNPSLVWSTVSAFNKNAPQTKYLSVSAWATSSGTYAGSPTTAESANSTSSVGRFTGIISTSGSSSGGVVNNGAWVDGVMTGDPVSAVFGFLAGLKNSVAFDYFACWTQQTAVSGQVSQVIGSGSSYTLQLQVTDTGGYVHWLNVESINCAQGNMSRTVWIQLQDSYGVWADYQTFNETLTYSNAGATYHSSYAGWVNWTPPYIQSTTIRDGQITYAAESAYSSSDVLGDLYSLLSSWPLSDETTYPWRTDEWLALTPLVKFDEFDAPVAPFLNYNPVMNDYSLAQVGGNWQNRAWLDPNNYTWLANGNSTNASMNPAGGNVIVTPIYTGNPIIHNPAGSGPHFWFASIVWSYGGTPTEWSINTYGEATPSVLPQCAMRWRSAKDSQYDATTGSGSIPQYPQSFIHQGAGVAIACKYVVATQPWPAVNYALATTPVLAGSFNIGSTYKIIYTGSTSFTSIGASSNAVGTVFVATGSGSGSGTAGLLIWTIPLDCTSGADVANCPATPAPSLYTSVLAQWTFNQRGLQTGYSPTPTWYGIGGCTGIAVQQFTYPVSGACRAVVGMVPYYSQSPQGAQVPLGGGQTPLSQPAETFTNFVSFPMPDTLMFDDQFGAHWQSEIFLTMDDPLCAPMSIPSCTPGYVQDNGCGYADSGTHKFYPATPLVEASCVQTGSLPSGVYLPLDPAHNTLLPPCYPLGIPIPAGEGGTDFNTFVTDWGLAQYVCQSPSSRFAGFYSKFVNCQNVSGALGC